MHPGSLRERCTCSRLNLRTSSRESSRALTLPVTTIILSPPPSLRNCVAGTCKVDRLLRPAFQRGTSGIGQDIDAALGAIEPAVDIVQQDFRRLRNLRLEIAHPPWPSRQRGCAGQRLLPIG